MADESGYDKRKFLEKATGLSFAPAGPIVLPQDMSSDENSLAYLNPNAALPAYGPQPPASFGLNLGLGAREAPSTPMPTKGKPKKEPLQFQLMDPTDENLLPKKAPQLAMSAPAAPQAAEAAQPSVPAPRLIPAQWQDVQRTNYHPYSPEEIQQGNELLGRQKEATHLGARIESSEANEQVKYVQNMADLGQVEANRKDQLEAARQAHAQQLDKNIGAVRDDYLKAAEIDPNRAWANKSAGQKVMNVLGLMAGGFLQGFRSLGQNPAATMLNEEIQRDIDSQKANLGAKGQKLEAARGEYADFLRSTGDARLAEDLTFNAKIDAMKMQLGAVSAKYQDPKIQLNAANAINQLDQLQQAKQRDIEIAKTGVVASRMIPAHMTGPTGPQPTAGMEKLYTPFGYARDEETAKAMNKRYAAAQSAVQGIERVQALRQQHGVGSRAAGLVGASNVEDKMKAEAANITSNMAMAFGGMPRGGAILEHYGNTLGNLNSLRGATDDILEQQKQNLLKTLQTEAEASGIRSGTAQIMRNPHTGQTVEVGNLTGQIRQPAPASRVKRKSVEEEEGD